MPFRRGPNTFFSSAAPGIGNSQGLELARKIELGSVFFKGRWGRAGRQITVSRRDRLQIDRLQGFALMGREPGAAQQIAIAGRVDKISGGDGAAAR